jgi:alpha-L-rhamnosidase
MSRIAAVLGRGPDSARYAELAASVRASWQAEFIGADGEVRPATQANIVRALTFGLLPGQLRERAAAQLVRLIREAGTHLGTGFLATADLLPALADAGHPGLAYELLFQDTPPSCWTLDRRLLRLDVTVPPGTTAEVVLPGGQARGAGPGRHSFEAPAAS